jgi:hypothetical protein
MQILLKNILKEVEDNNPLQVQIYCDMDGVLVNMDEGFKKISGGFTPKNFKDSPEFGGDTKKAQKRFWQLINSTPNFWINLEPMPDAKLLWDYLNDNFKSPRPVILSAGQGAKVVQEKTAWIRTHIDPTVKVMIAQSGVKKPEYVVATPGRTTHILIDDTDKNITAWDNVSQHRIGILHKNTAVTIPQLKEFLGNQQP